MTKVWSLSEKKMWNVQKLFESIVLRLQYMLLVTSTVAKSKFYHSLCLTFSEKYAPYKPKIGARTLNTENKAVSFCPILSSYKNFSLNWLSDLHFEGRKGSMEVLISFWERAENVLTTFSELRTLSPILRVSENVLRMFWKKFSEYSPSVLRIR